MELLSLQDVKKDNRLIPKMIRLPRHITEKAMQIAKKESVNETDVYRTAILNFFSTISTDSREESED